MTKLDFFKAALDQECIRIAEVQEEEFTMLSCKHIESDFFVCFVWEGKSNGAAYLGFSSWKPFLGRSDFWHDKMLSRFRCFETSDIAYFLYALRGRRPARREDLNLSH